MQTDDGHDVGRILANTAKIIADLRCHVIGNHTIDLEGLTGPELKELREQFLDGLRKVDTLLEVGRMHT